MDIKSIKGRIKSNWQLMAMLVIPLIYIIVFKYLPMYGVQISFRQFNASKGILGSEWVGLYHFEKFFKSKDFLLVLKNTLYLSFYGLLAGFPIPIIIALGLNYIRKERFKKVVQLTSYMPHFISVVVSVGILMQVFSLRLGVVNNVIELLGGTRTNFLANPQFFRHLYVWSSVWQNAGYGSIIYISALASIDPTLHEAAIVDGADKIRRIWHIDIPGILPQVVVMLILSLGHILTTGFEKVLLMQNVMNSSTSEVIDTYVYKLGLASSMPNYSYSAAVGLFQSVISFTLIFFVNGLSRRLAGRSLW